jgi:hypothetical protein
MSFKTWFTRYKSTSMFASRYGFVETIAMNAFKAGQAYERSLAKRRKPKKETNCHEDSQV